LVNTHSGLYIWPCSTVLSWYIFLHREFFKGKKILELGSGCSLPGLLSAFCGAEVILSDSAKYPHCLSLAQKNVELNGLGDKIKVIGLTWGLFLHPITKLKNQLDLIIGSDCFFDTSVFEDLIATVAYLLENNPSAKFLTTYQERSSDWNIEILLTKWGLKCQHIPLNDLANSSEIDLGNLMQDHTIHLLEITQKLN